jgi:hypothetical protein
MKLPDRVLEALAEMVVGDNPLFPYRSSFYITRFFERCGLPYTHDGSTRRVWTMQVLEELNLGPSRSPDLPSDSLLRIIDEMFDPYDFDHAKKEIMPALAGLGKLLSRHGLTPCLDGSGHCVIRNSGTGASSSFSMEVTKPLTAEETAQRARVRAFLDTADEDQLTEKLLVPLFKRLGFQRVSPSGHKEKALEFGKDLWMKYQLPTGHWLYFCAQIKREKIDASASGGTHNAANVLAQARMAIENPIFDPEVNKKVLVDHIFIITAAEITRAARTWIGEMLNAAQRRQIIFMDRDEFLDHSARILLDLH